MGWLGKVVGGTFGLMLGGPLGMIAGAAFGHLFDASPQQEAGAAHQKPFWYTGPNTNERIESQEQAQMVFFVATFSMLGKLAAVDGSVSEPERSKVREFIGNELRLQGQARDAANRIFETASHSGGSFEQFAQQFYQLFHSNHQMLELMIDILYRVSYADGDLSVAEDALIRRAADLFGFSFERTQTIRNRYNTSERTHAAYSVLGISQSASDEEVKSSYRRLVSEYHPDKIASKGLPEEFVKFAGDKFREIQEAYEQIRKQRGI